MVFVAGLVAGIAPLGTLAAIADTVTTIVFPEIVRTTTLPRFQPVPSAPASLVMTQTLSPSITVESTAAADTTAAHIGAPLTLTFTFTPQGAYAFRKATATISGLMPALAPQAETDDGGTCTQTSAPDGTWAVNCGINSAIGVISTVTVAAMPVAVGTATVKAALSGTGAAAGSAQPTLDGAALAVSVGPPNADLAVRMPAKPLTVRLGREARVSLVATSSGPSAASDGQVAIVVPPFVRVLSATPSVGACSLRKSLCYLGNLTPGQTDVIVLRLRASAVGAGALTATVANKVADPQHANDRASVRIAVAGAKR